MGSVPVPSDDAGKEEVIDSLVANVEAMIKADRKITSLKELQVIKLAFSELVNRTSYSSHILTASSRVIYGGKVLKTKN